jgi:hypothetical protein
MSTGLSVNWMGCSLIPCSLLGGWQAVMVAAQTKMNRIICDVLIFKFMGIQIERYDNVLECFAVLKLI